MLQLFAAELKMFPMAKPFFFLVISACEAQKVMNQKSGRTTLSARKYIYIFTNVIGLLAISVSPEILVSVTLSRVSYICKSCSATAMQATRGEKI
jgi:hypothetical protein